MPPNLPSSIPPTCRRPNGETAAQAKQRKGAAAAAAADVERNMIMLLPEAGQHGAFDFVGFYTMLLTQMVGWGVEGRLR